MPKNEPDSPQNSSSETKLALNYEANIVEEPAEKIKVEIEAETLTIYWEIIVVLTIEVLFICAHRDSGYEQIMSNLVVFGIIDMLFWFKCSQNKVNEPN